MTDTTQQTHDSDFVGPMPQLQPVADNRPKQAKRKPAQPVAWVTVFNPRGGPCTVNRPASQQGALVTAAIDAGSKGANIDTLVDAARPYSNKVTGDYVAYALSYLVPSWVQVQNGFGVQVRSVDRKLMGQLKDMQRVSISKVLKLARSMDKVDSLRIRVTVPGDNDQYKRLVKVH